MSYELKQSDIFDLANFIGAETKEKGDELFFKWCPKCRGGDHRDKETFSVNLKTGAFKCFRASCDYHGHFVELARDVGFELDHGQKREYRQLPQRKLKVRDAALDYLASRGISAETGKKYNITTQANNDNILVFPFYDENGVLQSVKYRNAKFRKGIDKNKEWFEADTKPILFGMNHCNGFDRLIITEGQLDSLSVADCGIDNAVSVPTGAMGFTWVQHCWSWITKFKEIVVFGDYEHGSMSLLDPLRQRLPNRILSVRLCDYLGEKDANDILRKFGKQAIITAVENAEPLKLSNVKDLSTVKAVDINELPKIRTNITDIDRLIGGLVMGQVILLTGKRGDGKSTFMSQLICEALDQGESVFVYSGELADYHFKRWLDYQLAGNKNIIESRNIYGDPVYTLPNSVIEKINHWYAGRAYIYDNSYVSDDSSELESITDTIEGVIRQYGVKLVCIDNLMTAMDVVERQDNLYLAQSNFVGKLKKIAVRLNVAIILVAHPRKSNGQDFSNDDVSGSSDITNKVDVVMSYKKDETDDHDSLLYITKNRLFGKCAYGENAIQLKYSDKTKRVFGKDAGIAVYGWEKEQPQGDEDFDLLV